MLDAIYAEDDPLLREVFGRQDTDPDAEAQRKDTP